MEESYLVAGNGLKSVCEYYICQVLSEKDRPLKDYFHWKFEITNVDCISKSSLSVSNLHVSEWCQLWLPPFPNMLCWHVVIHSNTGLTKTQWQRSFASIYTSRYIVCVMRLELLFCPPCTACVLHHLSDHTEYQLRVESISMIKGKVCKFLAVSFWLLYQNEFAWFKVYSLVTTLDFRNVICLVSGALVICRSSHSFCVLFLYLQIKN